MRLSQNITRVPRPFDAQKGQDVAAACGTLDAGVSDLLAGVAGCSPYLAGLIEKECDWLIDAIEDFDGFMDSEIGAAAQHTADGLAAGLRRGKRRVALLAAIADLGGAWSLEAVTGALSRFADASCQSALRAAILQQIKRGKIPGMSEDDVQDAAGMVVLAMGKMGAAELNYSSDIDLICLFDETRFDPDDFHDARAAFARATRTMAATLSEITDQGYVFRTDLRLRPDPSVTPVCMAMEAAENYYESLGRTWERAAYIKARPCAGDITAGLGFLDTLTPFVWRRHLDFAAIQDAHDMRLAIRQHKGLGGPITLPGHNMKLGRGGIREIEFFTQTRQLIAGGRDPDLRCRGTKDGLKVLAEKGWIDPSTAQELSEHYTAHRTVEHRLQMIQDAQTHSLPKSTEGVARLAAMMDQDVDALQTDIISRLEAVHEKTEGFFAPSKSETPTVPSALDTEVLSRWVTYPALRSTRSREVFERVKPDLLSRLSATARPNEALLAFDGFLSGLPAGVQLFSLLEANPQLSDLIIDITGTSPALAHYLSRNASVFDAVIGGGFFSEWPGQDGLNASLTSTLQAERDYETRLDATRRWFKEWHFRIGVHLLRGLTKAPDASRQYSDLARTVVNVIWPLVVAEFSAKHGPPPGRGAVVLGMGSLGAGQINAGSDLDLIVIYDPQDVEASDGKRPLQTRPYYARLTQSLITALTVPMSQGKLFEVDMRLRPSGNQGPVAASWSSFKSYQKTDAWVWEHLALTRAAVVAGSSELAADITDFRAALLTQPRDAAHVGQEVASMRARIQEAKQTGNILEVKIGRGRMQEVELIAQAGALLAAELSGQTQDGLKAAAKVGLVSQHAADKLMQAASLFHNVHTAVRLLSDKPLDINDLGPAAEAFLLQTVGHTSLEELEADLQARYDDCAAILDDALAPFLPAGGAP